MWKAKFTYNEPRFETIEVEGQSEAPSFEDVIKIIEDQYPETIDIEVLEVVEFNG